MDNPHIINQYNLLTLLYIKKKNRKDAIYLLV
jgi:hypothetical protein